MHGLINRSIQCFLRDTYGADFWAEIVLESRLGFDNFEAMLTYDPRLTEAVLDSAAELLRRNRDSILEDYGTYLVSHPNLEALRRLLRFGGGSFVEFLQSLEDMRGRGQMALPDLDLPDLVLVEEQPDQYRLHCNGTTKGVGHVMMGLLRAMADDYGTLVLLEHCGADDLGESLSIQLLDARFAEGRRFDLAASGH
jgi:hypothetical protein